MKLVFAAHSPHHGYLDQYTLKDIVVQSSYSLKTQTKHGAIIHNVFKTCPYCPENQVGTLSKIFGTIHNMSKE